MELTLKDRLILANQYLILEKLYPNEADRYANLHKALKGGYTLEYGNCVEDFDKELSPTDCDKVLDILRMYRALNSGFRDLVDKSDIDPKCIRFMGFDGTCESNLTGYTRYWIENLGRYEDLKNDNPGFDNHRLMMPEYQQMLAEWRKSANPRKLTKSDIQRIVGAQFAYV